MNTYGLGHCLSCINYNFEEEEPLDQDYPDKAYISRILTRFTHIKNVIRTQMKIGIEAKPRQDFDINKATWASKDFEIQ